MRLDAQLRVSRHVAPRLLPMPCQTAGRRFFFPCRKMGRRALPKIDPAVDLTEHLFTLESLPEPFDPQSLFPLSQPLEIEIGSGKGLFLLNQSQRHAERNYLGNEIAARYARLAAGRSAIAGRANARVISGDGLQFFHRYLPDRCASGVHVYFPDPWWKKRHRRRRVMQPDFIADVQRVLQPGGFLQFWTDVEEYFEETLQLIADCVDLQGPIEVAEPESSHDMDYRTHFERRMRIGGHDVFRAEFIKQL